MSEPTEGDVGHSLGEGDGERVEVRGGWRREYRKACKCRATATSSA